jgi:hypothetical protein
MAAGGIKGPHKIRRTACLVWNAGGYCRRLAQAGAHGSRSPETYSLPWSTFPASLKVDVDAYLDRLAGKDILTEPDLKTLKPGSVETRRNQLHQFISALVHRGHDPQTLRSLTDLVPVATVKQGLRFFLDRPRKAQKHAYDIAGVLRAVARHWVGVDAAHLEQLKAITRRLEPGRGMTECNQDFLRQFDDPANIQALVNLPQRILAGIPKAGKPTRRHALDVQVALAIEILLKRVVLHPGETGFEIELIGEIANMVDLGAHNKKADPKGLAVHEAYQCSVKVVAGERNHRQLTLPPVAV